MDVGLLMLHGSEVCSQYGLYYWAAYELVHQGRQVSVHGFADHGGRCPMNHQLIFTKYFDGDFGQDETLKLVATMSANFQPPYRLSWWLSS